jgi:outer membrane protein assembly factor BamA
MRYWFAITALLHAPLILYGQETRAGQIEQAREEKDGNSSPYLQPKAERRLIRIQQDFVNPIFGASDGLHLRIGRMVPGSGFALGPEYRRSDLFGENLVFRIAASASTRRWYQGIVEASLPKLFDNHAFLDFSLLHRDYASMPYYGPGPKSRESGRSDYRLEDSNLQLTPGIRPFKSFRAGAIGGFLSVNAGPGSDSRVISTEQQFLPQSTPGIDRQTNFWQGGGFVEYDWRDYPGETTSGGFYSARYLRNSDRSLGAYSFGRVDLEARQFIPFFNHKRVIALRGLSSLTTTSGNQQVPFYMQPTLGGPNDLRGFRPFRFYGDNRVATTAEYRWEASTVLEMSLFFDAGKVFDRWSQWNMHHLESSYGFGFRFKNKQTPVFRIDTGFSREGIQLWVRFNNSF